MSSTIDSRIVTMKFDNKQFESQAKTSLSTLQKIKDAINFKGGSAGLQEAQKAVNGFSLGNMLRGTTAAKLGFVALGTVAVTALSRITSSALQASGSILRQLSGVQAAKDGYDEYALTLNTVQTMMNATGESNREVSKTLQDLNHYSDQTIYSFRDMTDNIAKFTNAGLSSKEAAAAIKGISNVAAASGASTNEAARSMYNFAQAMSAGVVKAIDWRSIELANMGTVEFKQQLIDSAVAMGTLTKKGDSYVTKTGVMVSATKNFSGSLAEGWLAADVLNKTLARYSDNSTKIGKKAQKAATQVKTITQAFDIAKESMGSGWSKTWQIVFGNLNEASKTFTAFSDVLSGWVNRSADSRNKVLSDWKKFGGRTAALEAIKNIFEGIVAIVKPIKEAFRDIFPAKTGKDLANITKAFRDFTEHLTIGEKTSNNLKRTFKGIFAVFSILGQVLGGVIKYVAGFFGLVSGPGAGGLLSLTAAIGDVVVGLDKWLKKSNAIEGFFDMLGSFRAAIFAPVAKAFGAIAEAAGKLISTGADVFFAVLSDGAKALGPALDKAMASLSDFFSIDFSFDADKVKNGAKAVVAATSPLAQAAVFIQKAWQPVKDAFGRLGNMLKPLGVSLKEMFGNIKDLFKNAAKGMDLQDVLSLINTAMVIGLVRTISNIGKTLNGLYGEVAGTFGAVRGTFENVGKVLNQVTSNLKTMQNAVRADMILKIGLAIAALAGALFILSKIPAKDIGIGLGAIGALLTEMVGAMVVLEKTTSTLGAGQLLAISGAMVVMGFALITMAGAVTVLSKIDTGALTKGLTAIGVILTLIAAFGGALTYLGAGGLSLVAAAFAIGVLSVSLVAFAGTIKLYDSINWGTFAKGLGMAVIAIAALGATMMLMAGALPGSVALGIIALALIPLAASLTILGKMDLASIAKALIALGGALGIISTAMLLMVVALPGAIALAVIAKGLVVLTGVLVVLGSLSWSTILGALGKLALIFGLLGGAGLLLAPIVPVLIGLSLAVTLLGAGMALAGVGMLAFATGLATLAVSGTAGAVAFTAALVTMATAFPVIMEQIGYGLVAFAKVIAKAGEAWAKAITAILKAILKSIRENTPDFAKTLIVMIKAGLQVIRKTAPDWAKTGVAIIVAFLNAVDKKIEKITDLAVSIVSKFIETLGSRKNVRKLTDSAADMLVNFLDGFADAIDRHAGRISTAGRGVGAAILKGIIKGLGNSLLIADAVGAALDVASKIWEKVKDFLGIHSPSRKFEELGKFTVEGLALGIRKNQSLAGDASEELGASAVEGVRRAMREMNKKTKTNLDVSPVVKPVMDLTEIKKGAGEMLKILPKKYDLDTSAMGRKSYRRAQELLPGKDRLGLDTTFTPRPRTGLDTLKESKTEINFKQENHSPKALSTSEIYRNTNNQLAQLKEALKII